MDKKEQQIRHQVYGDWVGIGYKFGVGFILASLLTFLIAMITIVFLRGLGL